MGTNFYDLKDNHVGKRSAAGLWCWDCGTTLCKDGMEGVHQGNREWYKECPICGKKPVEETLDNSSGGRELGFNRTQPKKKKGVATCSSFSWAMNPFTFIKKKLFKDEYKKKYSKKQFLKMLEESPIQYFEKIGKEFS